MAKIHKSLKLSWWRGNSVEGDFSKETQIRDVQKFSVKKLNLYFPLQEIKLAPGISYQKGQIHLVIFWEVENFENYFKCDN